MTIEVHGLEVSPELMATIPGPLPREILETRLYGKTDITIQIERAASSKIKMPWNVSASVDLRRGRLEHPLLPRPITDLVIKARGDRQQLQIEKVTGKFGTANIGLACTRQGWTERAPFSLAARVTQLRLDRPLQAKLPDAFLRPWKRFRPAGLVDGELQLTFDGRKWRPTATIHCQNVSFTDMEKFPYPLKNGTGTIKVSPLELTDDLRLEVDLTAMGRGKPIQIGADLKNLVRQNTTLPPRLVGWIEISGAGIPIHQSLVDALPPKGRKLVQALHSKGLFDFRWRAERAGPLQPKFETTTQLQLNGCSIQYDRFPYPLHNIHGLVTARNRHWTLHDLVSRSRNGSTVVTCRGESRPSGEGAQLQLVFQGEEIPLNEDLRESLLLPEQQKMWADLRPQGRINLTAQVQHQTGQKKPVIHIDVRSHQQSVSIEPIFFPYRLEQIDGQAILTDGQMELRHITARHGRVTFSSQGIWQKKPDGGWQFQLTGLHADRLNPQGDLVQAMPPRLRKVVDRLHPRGTFGLHNSTLTFTKKPGATRLTTEWDIGLHCHQADLLGSLQLKNISGSVRLKGQSDGQRCTMSGELDLDSLVWKEMQLTNVHGPLWVNESVCLLGRPATEKQALPPRRITAQAYGGTLVTDIHLRHAGHPRYHLEMSLGGLDLARFANERLGGPSELKGMASGKLSLSGTGYSTHALTGSGDLHIVDAHIYKLPVLVALLKVLQNRTPDTTAFNRCDMQFNIQGEHVHFQQLNLLGDAVSLYGRGETNFDRDLNLIFYSLVGRSEFQIPLLKNLVGQASQQILQLKVDGTWDHPESHSEAFPAVSKVLQQIQEELQPSDL